MGITQRKEGDGNCTSWPQHGNTEHISAGWEPIPASVHVQSCRATLHLLLSLYYLQIPKCYQFLCGRIWGRRRPRLYNGWLQQRPEHDSFSLHLWPHWCHPLSVYLQPWTGLFCPVAGWGEAAPPRDLKERQCLRALSKWIETRSQNWLGSSGFGSDSLEPPRHCRGSEPHYFYKVNSVISSGQKFTAWSLQMGKWFLLGVRNQTADAEQRPNWHQGKTLNPRSFWWDCLAVQPYWAVSIAMMPPQKETHRAEEVDKTLP